MMWLNVIHRLFENGMAPAPGATTAEIIALNDELEIKLSRSNPPRIEPPSQADNQDPATVNRLNGNGVDRQNEANDTRGVQLGIRETGIRRI